MFFCFTHINPFMNMLYTIVNPSEIGSYRL